MFVCLSRSCQARRACAKKDGDDCVGAETLGIAYALMLECYEFVLCLTHLVIQVAIEQ